MNKVEFGISNLYVGTFDEDSQGNISMGNPEHIPGAVSLTLDAETNETKFYADNTVYWSDYTDNGFSGEVNVALFPESFKLKYLGYEKLANGGVAQVKNAVKPKAYLMFQAEGDEAARKVIMYNIAFGAISREHNTVNENKEVDTETIPITVTGSNSTGITRASFDNTAAAYPTLFTAPPAPARPTEATQSFTGDGSTDEFELTNAPVQIKSVRVAGLYVDNYTLENKTLTFDEAPASGAAIVVTYTHA